MNTQPSLKPETTWGRSQLALGLPRRFSPRQRSRFRYALGCGSFQAEHEAERFRRADSEFPSFNYLCRSPEPRKHFNSTLSVSPEIFSKAIVKWRLRYQVKFTMTMLDGNNRADGEAIIVHRAEVEAVLQYSESNCGLRDRLLIRLPREIGLRTGELCTLAAERINWETREFQVLDSKKYRYYDLPLSVMTLQLIEDLLAGRKVGLVFGQRASWKKKQGKPLRPSHVWKIINGIGKAAGVDGFSPRKLREYFAYEWYHVDQKSVVTLQRIMRHRKPGMTLGYVSRMVSWEDLKADFNGVKKSPVANGGEVCGRCVSLLVCKFAPLPPHATGCRYMKVMEEQKT